METAAPPVRELNPLLAEVRPSEALAVTARARALREAGRDIVALSLGEPDFDTPAPIVEAAIAALRAGFTHYTPNPGIPELRRAIADKFARENGLAYAPEQILCSNGAKQSIAQILIALCRPGDEVLVPAPYWVSYPDMVRIAGGTPVALDTRPEHEYRVTPDELEAAITERTRVLLFNSPSNPTGAVYPPDEVEAFAEVLRRHPHVFVIADEIYEHVRFDAEHISIGSLDGMYERTLTVNGFSKAYAMTGWRLGYVAGPRWIVDAAAVVQSQLTSAPNSIAQKAGVVALTMDPAPVEAMVAAFRQRRDFVLEALARIPDLHCPKPEGAFYLFPDVSAYYGRRAPDGEVVDGSEALCAYLLEAHGVALVPGHAFGADYGVRISYAASMDDLRKATERLAAGLAALRE